MRLEPLLPYLEQKMISSIKQSLTGFAHAQLKKGLGVDVVDVAVNEPAVNDEAAELF